MSVFMNEINAIIEKEIIIRSKSFAANLELKNLKAQFESLIQALEYDAKHAKHLYDDMKSKGLEISTVEAEGYLRCSYRIQEIIKENKEDFE